VLDEELNAEGRLLLGIGGYLIHRRRKALGG
jgi:hypothetical protein